ncbi:MAG: hypothetical protein ABIH20_01370 [Candidatus Diapherotrites archaeon]
MNDAVAVLLSLIADTSCVPASATWNDILPAVSVELVRIEPEGVTTVTVAPSTGASVPESTT